MRNLAYISTHDQSSDAQHFDIAQKHNIERWFIEGTSESIRILERPGFLELHKFARKGDTVIVCSIETLGRDSFELYDAFEALRAKGVNVASVGGNLDLSSPTGKIFLETLTTLTELRRTISRRRRRERK
ncbi:recombinase family protein [Pseudomonas sp. O230]|uniref:recombinase family protein n=1 Tax=Pseudomonas sp. O230 TaxID=3159450 RepID=UPI00387B26A1